MTELTFRYDDDTMVLAIEERHVDTVIDAMQKQGWTLGD